MRCDLASRVGSTPESVGLETRRARKKKKKKKKKKRIRNQEWVLVQYCDVRSYFSLHKETNDSVPILLYFTLDKRHGVKS